MNKIAISFVGGLFTAAIAVSANSSKEDQTIALTDPKQIADAMALQEAIDKASERVMECVEKKLAPREKCSCLYPNEVNTFKEKYELALRRNPEWRDKIVHWTVKGSPMGYNLVFPGLRRQVEMRCEKR